MKIHHYFGNFAITNCGGVVAMNSRLFYAQLLKQEKL